MNLSLRARILLAVVVAVVVADGVVLIAIRTALETGNLRRWSLPAADLAACEADPARWSQRMADVAQGWAYDVEGRSANPAAPPLDPAMLAATLADGSAETSAGTARLEALRVAEAGPCAIVTVRFEPPVHFEERGLVGLLGGVGAALLVVVGVAIAIVLQPLLERIHRIRNAAAAVGTDAFQPGADALPDDLGEISRVLDASHARIARNEAELVARHRALERHLAEIAHDLRTPLASLLLAVQELAAAIPGLARAPVSRALDDAEYVNALVDNLHQGTRLREGLETGAGTVDLADLVERLGVRFAALGRHRDVEVAASRPDGPLVVPGNPALAERAVANLVHNAVRHGRAGGHVAILLDRVGAGFELTVVDDGPGLRPDDLASLQNTTFLLEEARRRGGGLGVAITNGVCARLGWSIRYEAPEDGGLRVTIRG